MKYLLSSLMITLLLLLFSFATPISTAEEENPEAANIQIALLLDTSGSMDGLIDQAKSQLWNILNTLSDAKRNGDNASLQIALYHYGNDGLSKSKGFVQQLSPFTDNVDDLSEKLFALRTNGGNEYCGEVIYQSLNDLKWNNESDLRMIYIAGNESFAQGARKYEKALVNSGEKGVIVNTIYCGDRVSGVSLNWEKAALLGEGDYNFIDHNERTEYVSTPFDQEIADMNTALNRTYVAVNKQGESEKTKMTKQDYNASSYGLSNVVSRSVYKSKKNYNNASWDLVDAYDKNKDKVLTNRNLPGKYNKLESKELEKEIILLKSKRSSIQGKIVQLSKQRTAYIQKNSARMDNSLESIFKKSVQKRLIQNGFTFPDYEGQVQELGMAYQETTSIDYPNFVKLTTEVEAYRATRKIDIVDFYNYAKDPNTIILDTRSKSAFDDAHLDGAIHLNFSDFTATKLAKVIPNKNTRILIYCNNNFNSRIASLASKAAPLALNIPTFINLYGYGYKNIYELNTTLTDSYPKLQFGNGYRNSK